ncbi:hypothetical protein M413DRAFT_449423 [Hebeloma cylindrosporum]|uniref:Uncharacterized protein n=1 Tax=Hebeloma cylindrosporum TaxID=76867 RepID=A0A0C2Y500_HEBCY|nr:hypothetical protein M413DRAFT_449423 [Hebeloma cylindrosporum h7]
MNGLYSTRPMTPESPLTNSLYHATSTIDDLTTALANFSRVHSPEPLSSLTCCCGKEECENLKSWLDLKSRLDSRLVLSAEVGQALLQKHAAYVRQSERNLRTDDDPFAEAESVQLKLQSSNDDLHHELEELTKEKAQLEKRLNQALVNNEVTEVSNKTILQELQEAREMISRLTAHHARSVGWDTRLSAAMKERDDMQQERDGETHRARLAESRFAALKEKTAKLQTEVRRLQDSLEEKRHSRLELSETILQDAKSRLDSFRNSQFGVSAKVEEEELTSVLETLDLLTESREDFHALQEELEEQRAIAPPSRSGANTPHSHSRHFHSGSVPSISLKDYTFGNMGKRNGHAEVRPRRRSGPQNFPDIRLAPSPMDSLTPDTARSPTDSLAPSDVKWASFGQTSPRSSHVSYEVEEDADKDGDVSDFEKARPHRPLLLLTRTRGVQTDSVSGAHSPSPYPSHLSSISARDTHSESSSFSESQSSHISAILDRIATLLNRLTQADALTLTNRLKRQHLKGADIGHLSRSTVSNIIGEATGLRSQFRGLLEDDKLVSTCTRKDLRVLFKIVKDMFTEMGQLRVTLNDVVLDPASAPRISELALNPGKAEAEKRREGTQGGVAGWMAPISKLFTPTGRADFGASERSMLSRSTSSVVTRETTRPPRFVPKLGPALAASATTVNVEFSGTGVGRSVTSTTLAQPIPVGGPSADAAVPIHGPASSLMGIFAGAPQNIEPDPWIVVPTSPSTLRKSKSFMRPHLSTATIGRSTGRRNLSRLSQNVDAVIDVERPQQSDEEPDFLPPLLERTLRRRGLSDSSIHSTFTNQGDDGRSTALPPSSPQRTSFTTAIPGPSSRLPTWPDRTSVFQALTRTVQNLRASAVGVVPSGTSARDSTLDEEPSSPVSRPPPRVTTVVPVPESPKPIQTPIQAPSTPSRKVVQPKAARVASPNRGMILPNLTSWAAANVAGDDPFIASSLRDESYMQRVSRGRAGADGTHTRDFY